MGLGSRFVRVMISLSMLRIFRLVDRRSIVEIASCVGWIATPLDFFAAMSAVIRNRGVGRRSGSQNRVVAGNDLGDDLFVGPSEPTVGDSVDEEIDSRVEMGPQVEAKYQL